MGIINMTTAKSGKNGKSKKNTAAKKVQRSAETGRFTTKSHGKAHSRTTVKEETRTIKYHPLSTPESREKWRKAIKAVLAREKASEYKTK
jgi:hypothetical protein